MNLKETLSLLPLAAEHSLYGIMSGAREMAACGREGWWWKLRVLMALSYLIERPYGIMEKNRKKVSIGEENLIYGETPLLTIRELLMRKPARQNDIFIDLGCGRGLTCFYAHQLFGMPCRGIDIIPEFISKACRIRDALKFKDIEFSCGNFLDYDLSEGSIFYVAGTTFDEATMSALGRKLDSCRGTIISLSMPIAAPSFKTVHKSTLNFSWGANSVYIQSR